MSQLSHERRNALANYSASGRDKRLALPPPQDFVAFGKYRNMGVKPSWITAHNPGYTYWGLAENVFEGWQEVEAREVALKACHILPPRNRPSLWAFDMIFENNVLHDFAIVKASAEPSEGEYVLRQKHLDLSLISGLKYRHRGIAAHLITRFHEEFFDGVPPCPIDSALFFANPKLFDTACREKHCPKMPRYESR